MSEQIGMISKFLRCFPTEHTKSLTLNSPLLKSDTNVVTKKPHKDSNRTQATSSVPLLQKLFRSDSSKPRTQEMNAVVYSESPTSTQRRLRNRKTLAHITLAELFDGQTMFGGGYTVSLSPEEKYLLIAAPNSTDIAVFETENFRKLGSFQFALETETTFGGCVTCMVALPRQNIMLIGGFSNSGIVRDFSIRVFKLRGQAGEDFKASQISILKGHKGCVEKMVLSADGLFLVSLARDSKILFWDLRDLIRTGRIVRPYGKGIPRAIPSGEDISLLSVSEFMNGILCVACYVKQELHLWQIDYYNSVYVSSVEHPHINQEIVSLAWGKRDTALHLFSCTQSGEIKVWTMAYEIPRNTNECLNIHELDLAETFSSINSEAIGIVRDGRFLVSADKQGAHIWAASNSSDAKHLKKLWVCEYSIPDAAVLEHKETCGDEWVNISEMDLSRTNLEVGVSKFVIWSDQGVVVWPLPSFDADIDEELFSRVHDNSDFNNT